VTAVFSSRVQRSAAARLRATRVYVTAALLVAATLCVSWALKSWVGTRPMLILFVIPIAVSAYLGGFGAGLFATTLSALGAWFTLPTLHRLGFDQPVTMQVVVVAGGALACGIVGLALFGLRRDFVSRTRVEGLLRRANDDLETRVRYRTVELEAQLQRLHLLERITRAIAKRQDLQSIFQVVVRTLTEHLQLDVCCVCLRDAVQPSLIVTGAALRSPSLARDLNLAPAARVEIGENVLARCVNGALVYEPDVAVVSSPFPQRLAHAGLRALVAAPLLAESQVFGVLICVRQERESFSSVECEFLRQLSEHVALASHQAQLHVALQTAYEDLRQSQRAVLQHERLLALGQMASGIAHDINNAISPVTLYTDSLLEHEPNLTSHTRECLETVRRAVLDIGATVGRMREFYRPHEPQLALLPVDLNSLVRQVIELTQARWNEMRLRTGIVIEMRTELLPELPAIMGIESELRDALVNLIFNAIDAMPEGGPVTLRTAVVVESAHALAPAPARPRVRLEVSDNGVGMDDDTRRRCMEPFFTTKGERGTGLGLAMVYGTMQRHAADIEIESDPGHGTTLRFMFPVPSTRALEATTAAAGKVPPLRILVVDDDPLVMASLLDTLRRDGHHIATADGGQAGIDAFEQARASATPYEVVITDLGMPHVDGRKLATAVKMADPQAVVLLLTGWGQRLIAESDIPTHVDYVLSKPAKLQDLRAALANGMAKRARQSGSLA
jgi:signal transduction histidine kinase/ActR/RegA family two-component response regulator